MQPDQVTEGEYRVITHRWPVADVQKVFDGSRSTAFKGQRNCTVGTRWVGAIYFSRIIKDTTGRHRDIHFRMVTINRADRR